MTHYTTPSSDHTDQRRFRPGRGGSQARPGREHQSEISIPEKFVALLGTHTEQEGSEAGFSTYSDAQIKQYRFNERLVKQANKSYGDTLRTDTEGNIVVPPGHALIFFQKLIHSVKSGPQPETAALRVFHGFRLTTETVPLFDHAEIIENGASLQVKCPHVFKESLCRVQQCD